MLVLPDRIRDATIEALELLASRSDMPQDAVMDLRVAAGMLAYGRHLTTEGNAIIRQRCGELAGLLTVLIGQTSDVGLKASVAALCAEAVNMAEAAPVVADLPLAFDSLLRRFDAMAAKARDGGVADQALFSGIAASLMEWQVAANALGQVPAGAAAAEGKGGGVRIEDMQTLLRGRFNDESLTVSEWTILPGGFGKETCLFRTDGANGRVDLVMRRDVDASLITGVDCHEVRQEYPLLKSLFEKGFPVPESLFLERASATVPGPDFIIMRRMPGKVEGDMFGGEGKLAKTLQTELARVTARLHQLPPLHDLGEGTPEFDPVLWQMSTADCTRHYINAWYDLYLKKSHMPIPAVHGMVDWLLAHVPASDDRPTVVHGDIGMHNLLFDAGRLSSVLDWEFAHIGDPAEDLGIIYTVMLNQLDWDEFIAEYCGSGGLMPDMSRVRYYEIWMNLRNLMIASIALDQFASGHLKHVRYGVFATRFIPHYIERVTTLIRQWAI